MIKFAYMETVCYLCRRNKKRYERTDDNDNTK